jgi:predicted RNA-binding protein YlxR (DUF448 family)
VRPKKVPQRTCVGCHQVKGKKELVRIVRDPEGKIFVDKTGKASGRGAYICPSVDCLEQAIKGKRLERALERSVPPEILSSLKEQLEGSLE